MQYCQTQIALLPTLLKNDKKTLNVVVFHYDISVRTNTLQVQLKCHNS